MDAMPNGGTLTLRTRRDDGKVIIEVADTGSGLTREECERIFTPYYTSKQHGTGLGLAIVQSVVSDHGGRISVQSEPGKGTTFVIELPDNLEALPKTPPRRMRKRHAGRLPAETRGGRLPLKAHLLIVDDEANTLASLSRAFRLAGHEATVCDNAAKALELAKAQQFDLILSDVVMPGKDGLTLLEELKAQGVAAPVVMMSGQAHIEMAVRATRLGALDFLEKPISTDKLLLTVENALKLQRLESENRQLRQRLGKHEIVWKGEAMRRVMAQLERVAASESRVCILRRNRHRQGTGGAHDSRTQPAIRRAVRDVELRGGAGGADRVGTVRTREGIVHRRVRAPHRQVRAGRPGNDLSRRDRRHAADHAGQAAARAGRRRSRAHRRRQADYA